MLQNYPPRLPFKSVAGALLLSVFLGPIGLLYATTLGGIIMMTLGIAIVPSKLPVPIVIVWLSCCIWSVIATNRFNQKLMRNITHS